VFQNVSMKAGIKDIRVGTLLGQFGLGSLESGIELNGFTKDGLFRESVVLERLTMPDGILPPYADDFMADRFAIDLQVTGFDADAPVRLALADMDRLATSGSNPDFDAQMAKAFMPDGTVTVTLNDLAMAGKIYDVKMDGSATGGKDIKPVGKGAVHSKPLIPLITAMAALPEELGMGMASTGLIAFNAMAKKQADGSLLWDVEGTADGKFLINGVDYAALAALSGNAIPDQDPEMNPDQAEEAPPVNPDPVPPSDENKDADTPDAGAGEPSAPKQ
jgi:hypothetical protein